MKALQIQQFGEPESALKLVKINPQPLLDGEVRVRIRAAGINPSDLANARGSFPSTTLPRVIGRDFAGVIIDGPPDRIGLEVWGSGADIGFTRDGTHAETIDIPVAAVSAKPKNLSSEEAAVVGVPFIMAYKALEAARHKRGEWAIVTGAAGAVGSAAIELIDARGGSSIAVVRDHREEMLMKDSKATAVASSELDNLAEVVHAATGGRGADVALNGIGASVAPAILSSLAAGGRMAVFSVAFGGSEFEVNLGSLYRNQHELIGVTTATLDAIQSAAILNALRPVFESNVLARPTIAEKYSLDEFAKAYRRVSNGAGKAVFTFG